MPARYSNLGKINALRVSSEVFFSSRARSHVIADDLQHVLVAGESCADGPVAAKEDAIFAECIPENIENGPIKFHAEGRAVCKACSFHEAGDFHVNISARGEKFDSIHPFRVWRSARDLHAGAVIDHDAKIWNSSGEVADLFDLVRTAENIERESTPGEQAQVIHECGIIGQRNIP